MSERSGAGRQANGEGPGEIRGGACVSPRAPAVSRQAAGVAIVPIAWRVGEAARRRGWTQSPGEAGLGWAGVRVSGGLARCPVRQGEQSAKGRKRRWRPGRVGHLQPGAVSATGGLPASKGMRGSCPAPSVFVPLVSRF